MLRKLFGNSPPSATALQLEPLSPALVKSMYALVGAHGITPMPAAAQQAFEIATNPKADSRDFVALLEGDEALAARALKIANSVFFDRGNASHSLEQAVRVIGTEELRNLLSASSLGEIFPSRHPLRTTIWEHDLACASIARCVAPKVAADKQDSAYVAGLMHDIGKLLLLQRAPEPYLNSVALMEKERLGSVEADLQQFPFSHAEIGQLVAERWNFSSEVRLAIRFHHVDWNDPLLAGSAAGIVRIVKLANLLAHALGIGHSAGQAYRSTRAKEELSIALPACGLSTSADAALAEDLMRECAEAYARDRELGSRFGA